MLKSTLFRLNKWSTELNYGRPIIFDWVKQISDNWPTGDTIRIMDVGSGDAQDLRRIAALLATRKAEFFAVDCKPSRVPVNGGIQTRILDLERDRLPFESEHFDLLIANQIFEHIKDIFWLLSECTRVLRKGGHLIVSVPNLAALHNRVFLSLGRQPTCIHVFGPHVRGFTLKEFKQFLEIGKALEVLRIAGSNLFPLPQSLGRLILRRFPGLGISMLFLCELRQSRVDILGAVRNKGFDTKYFLGQDQPR